NAPTIQLPHLQGAKDRQDVTAEMRLVSRHRAFLDPVADRLQPMVRVLLHGHVAVHGGGDSLATLRNDFRDVVFRLPPRVEGLPAAFPHRIAVVHDPFAGSPPFLAFNYRCHVSFSPSAVARSRHMLSCAWTR